VSGPDAIHATVEVDKCTAYGQDGHSKQARCSYRGEMEQVSCCSEQIEIMRSGSLNPHLLSSLPPLDSLAIC